MSRCHVALYGNTPIQRGTCPKCKDVAFIRHGVYVCCGTPTEEDAKNVQRICEPEQRRHAPAKKEQDRILEEQQFRCIYCDMPFGTIRHRGSKPVGLSIVWDHKLPYSATQNNDAENFAAACQICNGIKSNFHFRTIEEAQIFLMDKRRSKGYDW